MAKVVGIGGVFFKSSDPAALAAWYAKWLQLDVDASFNGVAFTSESMKKDSYSVWSVFDAKTDYFQPSSQEYMINLMVDDLDGALAQVAEGGAELRLRLPGLWPHRPLSRVPGR